MEQKTSSLSFFRFLQRHSLFYFVSIVNGLALSAFFVLNSGAGTGWTQIDFPLDFAWDLTEAGQRFYSPEIPVAGMVGPLWLLLVVYFLKLGVGPHHCEIFK